MIDIAPLQAAYFDCNAAPPMDPRVRDAMNQVMASTPGNAGASLHQHGMQASHLIQKAKGQIARSVDHKVNDVIFTSGATESNNLAILGLEAHGRATNKRHLLTSSIEHPSVLEVCQHLAGLGFEHETVPVNGDGRIDPDSLCAAIRRDTLLVSVMAANNVTGVCQPIAAFAQRLQERDVFFHVDAAQGFGRIDHELKHPRIDLLSLSGHKIYGPKGIGALIARENVPLKPLMFGGGQQRGLRPGTLPTPLIVGFGLAAELAIQEFQERRRACQAIRQNLVKALAPFETIYFGSSQHCLPHVLCLAIPNVEASLAIAMLRDELSISRGSACTNAQTGPAHALRQMTDDPGLLDAALRFSWCHRSKEPDWIAVTEILRSCQ